jgi:hypothetical protein
METVNDSGDINWAWENINEKINTSATQSRYVRVDAAKTMV